MIRFLVPKTDIRFVAGLFYQVSHAVVSRWRKLAGSPSDFVLEARIFHSISMGAGLLILAYVPYDLFAGLYIAGVSSFIFGGIFFYEYYRSRFLRKPHRSLVFGIAGLLLIAVNYFANAGIQGSTDIIWPVYLLFLITICQYRHMVFCLVHLAEHQYPELVQYPFSPGAGQLTDRITAFPIPVISIAVIVGLFRRNYDKERAAVAQRDAEKGRLLSILSHDLRAPFIQVQHYFELLHGNLLTEAERAQVEQTLKHTNDQTLHLVTNLLFWSRSQLEGFSIRMAEISVAETLKSTLEMAQALSSEKGIAFTTTVSADIHVKADADMLQLAVRNLLQNAIKFTAPGGAISVETEILQNSCRININDTGTGIRPEQMNRLFSGTTAALGTANEKGVGLGLQLCKDFMERQGGSIQVESVFEKGSRFMVNIPLV